MFPVEPVGDSAALLNGAGCDARVVADDVLGAAEVGVEGLQVWRLAGSTG
ncbi:hypothetical protein ACTXG5_26840 [Mycobacterium sp. Dal123C01]